MATAKKVAAKKAVSGKNGIPYSLGMIALPGRIQARLFGVGSPFQGSELRDWLMRSDSRQDVICWFQYEAEGYRNLYLRGAWKGTFPGDGFRIQWSESESERVWLEGSKDDPPSCTAPVDEFGLLTRPTDETESRVTDDLAALNWDVNKARSKAKSAYVYVAYSICDDLLALAAKLEKNKVSADAFEKAVDAFLAERGIEKA